jgi:hypothetical protein
VRISLYAWTAAARWATVASIVASSAAGVAAQALTEREARVAYLYNFAKFVEWPAEALAPHAPISLCVLGDGALGGELEDAVRGHEIAGHKVAVSVVKSDGPIRSCHLLYVTGLDQKHSDQLLTAVAGTPVFTVSDADRFAQRGGVANLTFENGRMRFSINVNSAQHAHLTISSRLLALATIIKDEARTKE